VVTYRITRVQECFIDLDGLDLEDDESPQVVALEVADGINAWETVNVMVEGEGE
jgi:hypothetical protein